MRIAYFDCIAGISGDMALAALIDAGADFDELRLHLAKLPLERFDMDVEETDQQGLRATRVTVRASSAGVIRTYASIRALLDAADLPPEALQLAQRIFRRLAEAEARVHHKEVENVTFHEVGAVDSIVDIAGTALALSMLGIERVFASAIPTGLGRDADPGSRRRRVAPGRSDVLERRRVRAHDPHRSRDPRRDR
jgi:uncharacterized protein (DUF111 family)